MTIKVLRHLATFVLVAILGGQAKSALASEMMERLQAGSFALQPANRTHFIGIQYGTKLSETVSSASRGGYESAYGNWVGMDRWYKTNWQDLRLTWLTQISNNYGVIWGLGTGEYGEKYKISPSLKLGFIGQIPFSKHSIFTFRVSTVLGGNLREKSCTADYGEIGGVQKVNCRLAASVLPPSETLKYLFNESAPDRIEAMIQLNHAF